MKKQLTLLAAITALVAGAVTTSLAQGTPPGGGGPGPSNGTGVPIDGGASLLLAGGVAYAVREIRARRKKA